MSNGTYNSYMPAAATHDRLDYITGAIFVPHIIDGIDCPISTLTVSCYRLVLGKMCRAYPPIRYQLDKDRV